VRLLLAAPLLIREEQNNLRAVLRSAFPEALAVVFQTCPRGMELKFQKTLGPRGDHLDGFFFSGLRSRTPGPLPFSSMNSTPANSKADRSAASLARVTGITPSTTSTRRIVATPTLEALAKSKALHLIRARAARS
jgi:hypothetical protein